MTGRETATLAGGCFWCLEAMFTELLGVEKVESGYSGGAAPDPTYEEVSTGTSGYAEVVQIAFDPQAISFRDLLHVFFSMHDPTTLNRQGADVGSQYRSAVFYHGEKQKRVAEELIAELEKERIWEEPIVTEVTPFESFYKAEEHHQHFLASNPSQPYCRAVISPKLAKFRERYRDKLEH